MDITFRATDDPPGVEVTDPIEQRILHVDTPETVDLAETDSDQFAFPVQTAVSFETSKLRFDQLEGISVHDADGTPVDNLNDTGDVEIDDAGVYEIGVGGSIKIYIRVQGPFTIRKGLDNFDIRLHGRTRIEIGGRSLHERPAATIQVPDDVASLARGVSLFSSALKTLSPERSFPTLRGHPPLLAVDETFDCPDAISRPDSGITVRVPETYRSVATVASLSFYLGADIAFDDDPRVVTDHGFEYPLGTRHSFEEDVARLLKQQFLLDCVVRTEGLFPADLYERNGTVDHLDFDLAETYDADIGTRFERYTSVDYDRIEPYLPRWPLTAHVPDSADVFPALPHVADEIGVVRGTDGDVFTRSPNADPEGNTPASSTETDDVEMTFVEPARTDESLEHAWFGDHVPQGASKPTLAAFENQLDQKMRQASIDITVVCNDPGMIDEQEFLESAYKDRRELPYNVTTKFGLTADQLATVLTEDGVDFLHYIGHATTDGLRCIDGRLDVRELETVDVQTFLLNACQSHQQAMAFVERGAYGGVGTLGDVVNDYAIEIGKMFAYLLNLGFPLRAAIDIVSANAAIGEQYIVVGDGSVDIVQSTGGNPLVCHVDSTENPHRFEVSLEIYPTNYMRLGTQTSPHLDSITESYIVPAQTATYETPKNILREYLSWMKYPVRIDTGWNWNRTYDTDILD